MFINCATLTPAVHAGSRSCDCGRGAVTSAGFGIPQARKGELFDDRRTRSDFRFQQTASGRSSKALHYVGPMGKASEVKALVNMVMNINTLRSRKARYGGCLGLDLKMLCEIFSQTGANSRVLETDAEDMIIRDHDCYFSAEHAAKDSGIALEIAKAQGIETPLAQATFDNTRSSRRWAKASSTNLA